MTVQNMFTPLVSARGTTRYGAKTAMSAGHLIMAAGMIGLSLLPGDTSVWVIALVMVPVAFGGGLAMPAMTGLLLECGPMARAGLASGVSTPAASSAKPWPCQSSVR
ncbi:MFS transporter [Streptomyces caelestis]|uniref:hypothetical protein n=1 Tax=Streptomyces caelestis TaxID=36816 RepID=UPI0036F5ED3B